MSHDHVVELPKAVWAIKIVQTIIAVLVLAFSAFLVAVAPWSAGVFGFCIFAAIFSGICLVYFFVSVHSKKELYNWIALLVLECFCLLWWLVVWALFASALAAAAYVESVSTTYDNLYGYKRSLAKRWDTGLYDAAIALVYVTLALGLINWILYCVTLGFISMGIHRHRMAGKPMQAGGSAGWNNASRQEKHDMNAMPAPTSNGNNYGSPNGQAPAPQPMHYEHQPQQAPGFPPQQTNSYPNSPVPEVYGGNRYP